MSASLRQEFVSEFKAFYKLDKKKSSSLKQPDDDASIDSNSIIKGGGVGGGDEKENNSNNNSKMMNKIESSSSPTKSIEYFNNPPGRQKLTMETGGKWTMASNRGPNAILSPAAAATAAATSSDDNSSTRNNDNFSISRSIRSNGNRSSRSSQDETLWKEFKHEFAAYYMKKPAIESLDDSYEIEQEQEEEEKDRNRSSESIPCELSFEERYSKMYKLHTGVDVAQQQQVVVGVGNVQEEEEEEEVEGDDPALLLQ